MKRTKSRNAKIAAPTCKVRDVAVQTMAVHPHIEFARMQEQIKLLQLEVDVLRQHLPTSEATRTAAKADKAEEAAKLKPETTCKCKGNCSTKRCKCQKEDHKCTASCRCSSDICQNQEVVHENQEPDQDNKENIILNSAQTPMKKELVTQNEVGAKVNNLVADKRTSDTEEFNPMKPRNQLSRTPPTKNNRIFVDETHRVENTHQSLLNHSPQILALSFNIKEEPSGMEEKASSSFNVRGTPSDVEAEVDWERHTAQLIPCKKCKRKFVPHRIEKHEACCKKI